MKKFIISLLLISTLGTGQIFASSEVPSNIKSKGAVLIEQDSKRILYDKAAHDPLPMASTTKIMTCIVALENGKLDDIVTVSKRASRAPEVKLHLKENEKQRLGDLLYSLMLESHNDTAVAVAEHVGGSVENFCDMMTAKAKELGAENTSFKTPNGLDAPEHYTTPYDLAIIGAYALKNPEFVKITTTETINIPTVPVEGSHSHGLQNKNRFIYTYEGSNGLKTGFTNKAGHCFVGSAKRGDMQLIGVALAAGWGSNGKTQKYTDVINLMNYGFKNYKKYEVLTPTKDLAEIPLKKGKEEVLKVECTDQITLPLTLEEKENLSIKKTLPTLLEAPIQKGQEIGSLEVICQDKVLAHVSLKAEEDVQKATVIDYIKKLFNKR